MNVRRHEFRMVQGACADKGNGFVCQGIVTPECNMALGAADDVLAFSTFAGSVDGDDFTLQELYPFCFDQGIEDKGRPGFALAPGAVTAVHEQGGRGELVAYLPAGASSLKCGVFGGLI